MSSPDAPVELMPYDPAWPAMFEAEAVLLRGVLAPWLAGPIEHIGSTAVPGLTAKPVIDIMAGVESLDASRPAIAAAAAAGYCHWPYQAETEHWFCKPSPTHRTHHLHLIPVESPQWRRTITFRDHLRHHPATARDYAVLKQRLAMEHRLDREAYTDAKRPFIDRVVALAFGPHLEAGVVSPAHAEDS